MPWTLNDHLSNEKENNIKNAFNFKDVSSTDPISTLSQYRYIKLETLKRNGEAVATPVRIAPCGIGGQLKGQWYSGKAFLANQEELDIALNLRNKKYGFRARLAGIFSRTKGQLTGINISLD